MLCLLMSYSLITFLRHLYSLHTVRPCPGPLQTGYITRGSMLECWNPFPHFPDSCNVRLQSIQNSRAIVCNPLNIANKPIVKDLLWLKIPFLIKFKIVVLSCQTLYIRSVNFLTFLIAILYITPAAPDGLLIIVLISARQLIHFPFLGQLSPFETHRHSDLSQAPVWILFDTISLLIPPLFVISYDIFISYRMAPF